MYENNYLQVYVFLYTLYGGIIIGIIYDVVDVIINKHIIKKRSLADMLFWAIAFAIIIGILFYVNNITIRSYVFIGFGLGWFMYFYILSGLIRKILLLLQKILHYIYTGILKVLKKILSPLGYLKNKSKTLLDKSNTIKNSIAKDFKKYKRYFDKTR